MNHFLCIGLISMALVGCKQAVDKEGKLPEISFFIGNQPLMLRMYRVVG
jgi:hypothetical protein